MNIPATVKIPPFIQANPVFMLAAMFAHEQHEKVGQKREASGEPYIVHPLEVSELVYTMGNEYGYPSEWIEVAIIAALLHDTIEDTQCTYNEIETRFGAVVRDTVFWLTDKESLIVNVKNVIRKYTAVRGKFLKAMYSVVRNVQMLEIRKHIHVQYVEPKCMAAEIH